MPKGAVRVNADGLNLCQGMIETGKYRQCEQVATHEAKYPLKYQYDLNNRQDNLNFHAQGSLMLCGTHQRRWRHSLPSNAWVNWSLGQNDHVTPDEHSKLFVDPVPMNIVRPSKPRAPATPKVRTQPANEIKLEGTKHWHFHPSEASYPAGGTFDSIVTTAKLRDWMARCFRDSGELVYWDECSDDCTISQPVSYEKPTWQLNQEKRG